MIETSSENKITLVTMQIKVNELKGDQKDEGYTIVYQTRLVMVGRDTETWFLLRYLGYQPT